MSSFKPMVSYTRKEKLNILNYIIENDGYALLRGKNFWRRMQRDLKEKGMNRTWLGLQDVFKKRLIKIIDSFEEIPQEERNLIRDKWISTAKPNQKNGTSYSSIENKYNDFNPDFNKFSDEEDEAIETRRKELINDDIARTESFDLCSGKSSRNTPDIQIPLRDKKNTTVSSKQNEITKKKSESEDVIVIEDSDENESSDGDDGEFSFEEDKLLINYMITDKIYLKKRHQLKMYEYYKELFETDKTPKQLRKRFTEHIFPNIHKYSFLTHEQMCNFYKDAGVDIPENLKAILQTSPNTGDIPTSNASLEITAIYKKTETMLQDSPITVSSSSVSPSSTRIESETLKALSQDSPHTGNCSTPNRIPKVEWTPQSQERVILDSQNSSVSSFSISPEKTKINFPGGLKALVQNASNINNTPSTSTPRKITNDLHSQTTNNTQTNAWCRSLTKKINCCYYPLDMKGESHLIVSAISPSENEESIIKILSEQSNTRPENIHLVNFDSYNLFQEVDKFQNALLSQYGENIKKLLETQIELDVDLKDLFSSLEMHIETINVDDEKGVLDNNIKEENLSITETEPRSVESASSNKPASEENDFVEVKIENESLSENKTPDISVENLSAHLTDHNYSVVGTNNPSSQIENELCVDQDMNQSQNDDSFHTAAS